VSVLLVGSESEREDLRTQADEVGIAVIGEYGTLQEARASEAPADAILLAAPHEALEETVPVEKLTARESEVLELLAEGLSNKAIAARLGISDQTVKFHVASIGGKLGAANRTDAVRLAVRRGLIAL
jgi:DNA-binding NarL/FixJ family response regulator